ncbi:MAG TPA: transcription termination/antitermination NusG family protein [Candidatus Binatia bacterium]|nr:transcription termination/antitermination NusG family protein [Candidatus Binatia bacterium]
MTITETAIWRVLQTHRHKERAAEARLACEGVRTYLPLLLQWPRPAVGAPVGPMFPGYLFAQVRERDFLRVSRAPGVRAFVTFGGVPAELDPSAVAFLRGREDADGVIRVDALPERTEVVIDEGPLRGLVGLVERRLTARQRVLVLLDLLQRRTRVEVPEQWVRRA